ncbi:MAG: tRNA uridine-5-carboxymethylaminomethyl(34) synthesis enzyme MnmG [Endomicrobium sp.]|jgi:tRNA uridine 5-carboxymethylaminomethyl modification enzyme|nr:tRNA uridine-5-carboxymethylaminomethyl(34) synthesis enzyme MnmG [Endomicrobium sp.]
MKTSVRNKQKYNVVVIGAGHAGCEAAMACAKMGLSTLLITLNIDFIAKMSCNPSIGGIAKGQIVREIDAMGGVMGLVTDYSGLQFKMLNHSKGHAVWSPRAQCDKSLYSLLMSKLLQGQDNLNLLQSEVKRILVKNDKVYGVKLLTGEKIESDSVIVTTGTFLKGVIYTGKYHFNGGRFNEKSSLYLSQSLANDCGLLLNRFKTTTTPRVNALSINYSKLQKQLGDTFPSPFSHFTNIKRWQQNLYQLPCWITYTNYKTHKLVKENIHLSSINIGKVNSKSPRYCPSIEEKIERYTDKEQHRIFIEPEGYYTNEIYLNGLYTGLPFNLQQKMINSIIGLEKAIVIRYGYAIEYDYVDPTQLNRTLETKTIQGLFLGGQINGTTGYEEAAAQGFIAGVNAGLRILGKDSLILTRDNSYIGVLIDDITTKGIDEPYRMFTSRVECRLSIRNDNADLRLMDIGHSINLISDKMYNKFKLYKNTLKRLYNNFNINNLSKKCVVLPWSLDKVKEEFKIYKKYEGYIKIQNDMLQKLKKNESRKIPINFDYNKVSSLSYETKQRLSTIKPTTIGQAARIKAITPSDIAILNIYLEKYKKSLICKK